MSALNLNITLEDAELNDEELQEATQLLCTEAIAITGVQSADLIPITKTVPNAKGVGGFLVNTAKVVVDVDVIKGLLKALPGLSPNRTMKIEVEQTVGKKTKKVKIEVGRARDLEKALQAVEDLLKD